MEEGKKEIEVNKKRYMPVDKQVMLRYQVLNKCFRNRYREYTIDDLVDECNKALRRIDKPDVSKRTIQNDINILEADYGIELDEKLNKARSASIGTLILIIRFHCSALTMENATSFRMPYVYWSILKEIPCTTGQERY